MEFASLSTLAALFLRSIGALAFLPLGDGLSRQARQILLAAAFALLLADGAPPITGRGYIIFEPFLGALIGLPAALLISASSNLGELFDAGRGQSMGAQYDPAHGQSSQTMAILCERWCFALFLCAGLLPLLLSNLSSSAEVLPPFALDGALLSKRALDCGKLVIAIWGGAAALYAVFAGVFAMADMAVLLLSKAVPGASFISESFQIKSYLGFMGLTVVLQSGAGTVLIGLMTASFH